ncbi:MAG: ATP-binding cassette domain-containing protein [Magnetococcus sp. MYC-9]
MAEPVLELSSVLLPLAQVCQPMDWVVRKGEIWVIDGPSGSGKTTLFKVMTGLIQPRSGTVKLFGCDLNQIHARHLNRLRRRMGVLLEGDGLIPSWTVFENLALPWRYHDLLQKEQVEPYIRAQLLRYQEDADLLPRVVATLTLDQRLRMALLRTVQREPELLLLDNDRVAFHLQRLMALSLGHKLEQGALAVVVRGGAAIGAFFPKERIHLAVVKEGHLLAAGRWKDLCNHPNPDVMQTVKGY